MPEIPNVIASETIEVEWGNAIRDRTVQRYANQTERSSEHSSPAGGDLSYLANTGDIAVYHSGAWRSLLPTGTLLMNASATVPTGFLLCNGAAVSRSTYAALFAALGTTYGAGDGSSTFNLPDLRQRFPLGVAASGTGSSLGATGGDINHTHTGPSHTHTGPSHTHAGPTHNHGTPEILSGGAHTHSGPSHTHSNPNTGAIATNPGSDTLGAGALVPVRAGHTHSMGNTGSSGTGSTSSAGAHSHSQGNAQRTTDESGTTGAGGTGATGASGTGSTGTANPPFLALHYIIKT